MSVSTDLHTRHCLTDGERKIESSKKGCKKIGNCAVKCLKGTTLCCTVTALVIIATIAMASFSHERNPCFIDEDEYSLETTKLDKLRFQVERARLKEGPQVGRDKHRLKSLQSQLNDVQFDAGVGIQRDDARGESILYSCPSDFCPLPNDTNAHCDRLNKAERALQRKIDACKTKILLAEISSKPKPQPPSRRLQKLQDRLDRQSHRIEAIHSRARARFAACARVHAERFSR